MKQLFSWILIFHWKCLQIFHVDYTKSIKTLFNKYVNDSKASAFAQKDNLSYPHT
jgi:hypothetical protein